MANSDNIKKAKYDPNVVGLEESSEEEEESTDSEDDSEPEVLENGKQEKIETVELDKVDEKEKNTKIQTKIESESKKIEEDINKSKDTIKLEVKKPLLQHPTVHIEVKRDPKIQVARLKLPILGEEQRIMELINENEFLIVAGETGKFFMH